MTPLAWLCLGAGIGLILCGMLGNVALARDVDDPDSDGDVLVATLTAVGLVLLGAAPFVALLTGGGFQ